MQYLTQIFMVALVCCVLVLSSSVSRAKELTLPFGLQWGDSPAETEAKLKKECKEVIPISDPMFKNSILYGVEIHTSAPTRFYGVVGEIGLYEIVGMTIIAGKRDNKAAAMELADNIAKEMLSGGGKLTKENADCLYSISTSYIHAEINVAPSLESINKRFNEKTWTMLIDYTPPKNITLPHKDYRNEIKNTLDVLEELRR